MKSTDPTPPVLTRGAEEDRILGVLQGGDYVAARNMANEAARRLPEHARLEELRNFFDPRGKAHVVSGGPEPSREKELAWLSNPPDWAHGKWVALVGDEVVAHGDTLKEVTAVTRSRAFSRRPLVHRVD